MMHLKFLDRLEKTKLRIIIWKEVIKIEVEINKIKMKITIQRINETIGWFFDKINTTGNILVHLTKRKAKQVKLVMKLESLEWILTKYRGSLRHT